MATPRRSARIVETASRPQTRRRLLTASALALAATLAVSASRSSAQQAQGLDSLDEKTVVAKLSALKQDNLANRLMDSLGIPKDQRAGLRVLSSLEELNSTPVEKLFNSRRQLLMKQVVEGIDPILPTLKDANALMNYTAALIQKGIEPDVNTLEYWGENSKDQAELKPAVEAAMKLLDKINAEAKSEMAVIEKTIRGGNDPAGEKWLKLEATAGTAEYLKNMISYYLALSTDAGAKERKEVADKALLYLKDVDTEDSGVMPVVHGRMAKLYMVKGDFANARKFFDAIGTKDKKIKPEPNPGQQFEAKFFRVLTDVLDKKPDDAAKGLAELEGWISSNIPREQQEGVNAAVMLAKFRIASAQESAAVARKDAAGTKKFGDEASGLLMQLYEKFPAYRAIITDQLVGRLKEDSDLTQQSIPVLNAVLAKGIVEKNKPEKEALDKKVVTRAIAAAKELSSRKGVDAKRQEDAAILIPLFYERMGEDVQAGNAYISFAKKFSASGVPATKEMAAQAADRAVYLALQLRKSKPTDADVKDLYTNALGTAVAPPFRRVPLYYFYAQHLYSQGKPKEALPYYRAVPKGDPNEFAARFFSLITLNNELEEDTKLSPKDKDDKMKEMGNLVDQVRALGTAKLASAPNPAKLKGQLSYTTLLGADLAIRLKQADRAIKLLEGYEQTVAGQENAGVLSQGASRIRVNAYLAVNQLENAKNEVLKLAKEAPQETATLVSKVLERLDKDYEAAEKAGNEAELANISAGQAGLTGYLASWSASNPDPKIKDLALEYKVYDASTKRRAASRQKDPAQKKTLMDEAIKQYETARDEAKSSGKPLKPGLDANIAFNLGLAQYDLGNYDEAGKALGTLIYAGKLGGPTIIESVGGEERSKDNDAYWEATFKWIKSNLAVAKAKPEDPTSAKILDAQKKMVRELFITNGVARTGGQRWTEEFDGLRKELIPDWVPGSIAAPTTAPTTNPAAEPPPPAAPAPATQPVAAK